MGSCLSLQKEKTVWASNFQLKKLDNRLKYLEKQNRDIIQLINNLQLILSCSEIKILSSSE